MSRPKWVTPGLVGVVFVVAAGVVFSVGMNGPDGPRELRLPASERNGDVIAAAYVRLLDAMDARGEEAVLRQATPGQRMLYALRTTSDEIANGGTAQMLLNPSLMQVPEAIDAARRIGATAYAALLHDALRRYPRGHPREHDRGLDALDERWREDMFTRQLRAYMDRHPSQFFR